MENFLDRNFGSYADRLYLRVSGIASFPEHKVLERIEELFRLLNDPGDIPNDAWRYRDFAYVKAALEASVTLQAVGEVYRHVQNFSSVRNLVALHVDRIVVWIRHFYWMQIRNFSDPIHRNEKGKQTLINGLSRAFNTIYSIQPLTGAEHSHLHPQIISNFDVISGLWLEQDVQHQHPSASELFWHILPGAGVTIKDALVRSANGDADWVANVAITKLRRAMKTTPPVPQNLVMHLANTTILASGDHSVSTSLRDHQICSTFAKCIRLLAHLPAKDSSAFKTACARYFVFFDGLVVRDARDGTRALRQNIRFGLLESLAQLRAIYAGDEMDRALVHPIRTILLLVSQSLKAGPVCTEIVKALKDLPQHAFHLDAFNPPGWSIWNQFMVSVMAHSFFMKQSLAVLADEKEARDTCSNCQMQYPRSSLWKCAGCLVIRYCSEECQEEDWKGGHRDICAFYRGNSEWKAQSRVNGHSQRDAIYATLIAKYDIRRHRAQLRILAAKKHPNVHFNHIGFIVDYSRGFPTFDTFLLQNLRLGANSPSETAAIDMVENNTDAGRHTKIVLVKYPYIIGRENRQTSFIDLYMDGDSWEAPRLRAGIRIKQSEKRPSGRFKNGDIPLDASFDEVDEIARRMALCPNSMREPFALLDQVLAGLGEDWPFDSPFDFRHTISDSRIL